MTSSLNQAVVVVIALLTVLGGVAPAVGATTATTTAATDSGTLEAQSGPTVPNTETGESSTDSTTAGGDDTTEAGPAAVSGALRTEMAAADDGEQLPVIVVFDKRPQQQFDLQRLDEATATQKLQDLAASQQARAKSYLQKQQERNRASQARTLWSSNAMAVRATSGTIEELAGLPNVERIVYDRKVTPADGDGGPFASFLSEYRNSSPAPSGFERSTSGERAWGVDYIGADAVQERNVKGAGVNVSVVDTGIDGDHPALDGAVTEWKDFTSDNYSQPTDPEGHGTHVAGTIAARPEGEYAVGVAPAANLFGAKVFSENPDEATRVSDIVTAMEWSANNSADIISASIGIAPYMDEQYDNSSTGSDGQLTHNVRVYANASGTTSTNFSTDAYKPAYIFVAAEPVSINGTALNESQQAAIEANTSVALADPNGDQTLTGVDAGWVFPTGEVPDGLILKKFKPSESRALTADGNWTLTVTSDTGKNITYEYTAAPVYPSNGTDEFAESVNTITATHDVSTVIAAGNYGLLLGNRSVSSPGTASEAITVGATAYRSNDVAVFSSRGPVDYGTDERPGIDVIAPGVSVKSTVPTNHYPDTNYATSSGTSMATPHVSGTLALMLSAKPSATPDDLETTLEATAQDVPAGENAVGSGVIDAYAAVNATNASALGPESTETGRHTLYAGLGNTSDTSVYIDVEPHKDAAGDAGDAPDIWLAKKMVSQNFELTTYDDTAPNATFRLYIDADQNDSTGDADEGGAEFMVMLNRTYDGATYSLTEQTREYNGSTDSYEQTYNLSTYTGDVGPQYIELYDLNFDNREDTKPFDWHVTSEQDGSSPGDRFPNSGQATHGVSKVINGTAVAWNATAGQPDSGAPVTFKVYNDNGVLLSNQTVTTDADGHANADTRVTLTDAYEDDFVLEITDEHGNEIRQVTDIQDSCLDCRLDSSETSGLSYDIEHEYYDVTRNETVSINIPIYKRVDGNFSKYTGNASLRIGSYDNYLYLNNISVENGILRTEVNLNQTRIDEEDWFLDVHLALTGDFRNATATTDAASLYVESDTVTSLGPAATTVSSGESATLSFQNVDESSYTNPEPANVSTQYEVLWITDSNVASLYAELDNSLVEKIKQQKQNLASDEAVSLTIEDHRKIRQAASNLSKQGVRFAITNGTAKPETRGIGTFNVTPPEDARYGLVLAKPNVSHDSYYSGASVVYVEGRTAAYADSQTEPAEDDRYELEVQGYWPDVYYSENNTNLPKDHFNVTVRLYDTETDTYVENADVKLYTTFGQTRTVNTGTDGEVQVTFDAPNRDWLNISNEYRDQDVLGVAVGYQTADGGPVDDSDTIYGSAYRASTSGTSADDVIASSELTYLGNGTIQTTIEYRNRSEWEPIDGKETLVKVISEGDDDDVYVDFVDPAGQTNITFNVSDESVGPDEAAHYDSETMTADQSWPYSDHEFVSGFSVSVDAPQTVTDSGKATVTINVTDRYGNPIEGAAVRWQYLLEDVDRDYSGETSVPPQFDGDTRIAVTDSQGQATVEVSPDIAEAISSKSLYYQIGVATENRSVTWSRSGSITVEQEQGNVTGRIVYPSTTTRAGDLVFAWGYGTSDRTDTNGEFRMGVGDGSADVVFYQQHDNDTLGPIDDVPDVYAVKEVAGNESLGNVTLPNANRLNVTVVDESGDPVENATVAIRHTRMGAEGGWITQTNADGMFETSNRTGFEGVGNISVEVRPPENSTRFLDQQVVENVTLDSDKGITVKLDEEELVEGRIVYPDNTTHEGDQVIGWGWGESTRTDSDGQFALRVRNGSAEAVFYQDSGDDTPGPIDGVPDAYALGEFNNSSALGNVTLPEAHRLNVTVVTDDGAAVRNASVTVLHERNGATGGWVGPTNADGEFVVGDRFGYEIAGNASVAVNPPENGTGLVDETKYRNITVTEDRNLTVTLNTTDLNTSVELVPNETNASVGATTTYDVVVTNAGGGVGAYEGNVSVGNASVAEISAVELGGDPGPSTVTISADNSTVSFDGALADTNDTGRVVIASVTVRAENPGETNLDMTIDAIGNEYGVNYNITSTTGSSLNVTKLGPLRSAYEGPPTDVDGDGVYEDINGDGEFNIVDIQALYTVYDDSAVQNNTAFDVNGENGVDIVDVQALYTEYQNGGGNE